MSSAQHLLESRPQSVAHIFLSRVEATPDREAYRHPVAAEHGAAGAEEWRSLTWAQTAERVTAIAAGLLTLGLRPEERVAISSSTRVEWILADLGMMCAGVAATAVYPSTNAEETAYILADSGSRAIFVENAEQLAKVAAHTEDLPGLDTVVVFDPEADMPQVEGLDVLTLAELEKRGTAHLQEHPDAIDTAVGAIRPDQLATLIYTSGTTGRPKGVRLVHDCWSYQAVAQEVSGLLLPDDVQFLWLPLSHVFGNALIAGQVKTGSVIAVDGRIDRIITNLPAVRPTVMASAPRIFEKVYNGIAARSKAEGGAKHKIFLWAAQVARDYARTGQETMVATGRRTLPLWLSVQHAVADRLVYGKIRAAFGGELRGSASGSAALASDIGYFFAGAGVPVLEGYGLTETSAAVTVNPVEDFRVGTVGRPLPGTEVRVAEDGEILLKGPGVMRGYHNLPEKTAEVLESDGWFHTGDIGEIDKDGFVRITDRKKDLFKTSGGKYIAPTEIESRFKAVCPFASNILVIGNNRNYCTALITVEESVIMPWAVSQGLEGRSYAEVVSSPEVHALIDGFVRRVNGDLQRWQTIKKFAVLPRDLDIEHGELTPSLKVKRPVVEREYADVIEAMYEGAREA
ncbi:MULTISPECIES: long-chain fatty acid--CoA ligase [unclassified Streptomyces]|uniref:AMP-dependent synthetase/ligase n=1 Tax=unclassified Streptomyces TaxID=2593676 RepID=UPI001655DCA3|nr:AMP-dependent synthetase/ligase [Streptomyces sp. CB02980]MCB8904960.1 AMP-dependent synthetase/ligase [Streptomyces sp. CB02980]